MKILFRFWILQNVNTLIFELWLVVSWCTFILKPDICIKIFMNCKTADELRNFHACEWCRIPNFSFRSQKELCKLRKSHVTKNMSFCKVISKRCVYHSTCLFWRGFVCTNAPWLSFVHLIVNIHTHCACTCTVGPCLWMF